MINPFNTNATFIQTTKDTKTFEKKSEPCHVSIHWLAFTEYSHWSDEYSCSRVSVIFFKPYAAGG